MIGKIVIDVHCNGCMAQDHVVNRVGEIIAVKPYREVWPHEGERFEDRYDVAVCRTLQSREDFPEELFYVFTADSCLQPIPSGVGYFWRH